MKSGILGATGVSTGPMAERPNFPTSLCFAASITGWSMKAVLGWSQFPIVTFVSPGRTGKSSLRDRKSVSAGTFLP